MSMDSKDYDHVKNLTLLFFLDRLMDKGQPRTLHDLSCQFGTKGFTKEMRQIAGGSQSGLRKFLQQYPSLFTLEEDYVSVTNYSNGISNPHDPTGKLLGKRDYVKEAVDYFVGKLRQYGAGTEVPIKSLLGHRSQASPEVRHVSGQHVKEFRDFLVKSPDVFVVGEETVILKEYEGVAPQPFKELEVPKIDPVLTQQASGDGRGAGVSFTGQATKGGARDGKGKSPRDQHKRKRRVEDPSPSPSPSPPPKHQRQNFPGTSETTKTARKPKPNQRKRSLSSEGGSETASSSGSQTDGESLGKQERPAKQKKATGQQEVATQEISSQTKRVKQEKTASEAEEQNNEAEEAQSKQYVAKRLKRLKRFLQLNKHKHFSKLQRLVRLKSLVKQKGRAKQNLSAKGRNKKREQVKGKILFRQDEVKQESLGKQRASANKDKGVAKGCGKEKSDAKQETEVKQNMAKQEISTPKRAASGILRSCKQGRVMKRKSKKSKKPSIKSKQKIRDEYSAFGNLIANQLRSMDSKSTLYIVQHRICQVMIEAQMWHYKPEIARTVFPSPQGPSAPPSAPPPSTGLGTSTSVTAHGQETPVLHYVPTAPTQPCGACSKQSTSTTRVSGSSATPPSSNSASVLVAVPNPTVSNLVPSNPLVPAPVRFNLPSSNRVVLTPGWSNPPTTNPVVFPLIRSKPPTTNVFLTVVKPNPSTSNPVASTSDKCKQPTSSLSTPNQTERSQTAAEPGSHSGSDMGPLNPVSLEGTAPLTLGTSHETTTNVISYIPSATLDVTGVQMEKTNPTTQNSSTLRTILTPAPPKQNICSLSQMGIYAQTLFSFNPPLTNSTQSDPTIANSYMQTKSRTSASILDAALKSAIPEAVTPISDVTGLVSCIPYSSVPTLSLITQKITAPDSVVAQAKTPKPNVVMPGPATPRSTDKQEPNIPVTYIATFDAPISVASKLDTDTEDPTTRGVAMFIPVTENIVMPGIDTSNMTSPTDPNVAITDSNTLHAPHSNMSVDPHVDMPGSDASKPTASTSNPPWLSDCSPHPSTPDVVSTSQSSPLSIIPDVAAPISVISSEATGDMPNTQDIIASQPGTPSSDITSLDKAKPNASVLSANASVPSCAPSNQEILDLTTPNVSHELNTPGVSDPDVLVKVLPDPKSPHEVIHDPATTCAIDTSPDNHGLAVHSPAPVLDTSDLTKPCSATSVVEDETGQNTSVVATNDPTPLPVAPCNPTTSLVTSLDPATIVSDGSNPSTNIDLPVVSTHIAVTVDHSGCVTSSPAMPPVAADVDTQVEVTAVYSPATPIVAAGVNVTAGEPAAGSASPVADVSNPLTSTAPDVATPNETATAVADELVTPVGETVGLDTPNLAPSVVDTPDVAITDVATPGPNTGDLNMVDQTAPVVGVRSPATPLADTPDPGTSPASVYDETPATPDQTLDLTPDGDNTAELTAAHVAAPDLTTDSKTPTEATADPVTPEVASDSVTSTADTPDPTVFAVASEKSPAPDVASEPSTPGAVTHPGTPDLGTLGVASDRSTLDVATDSTTPDHASTAGVGSSTTTPSENTDMVALGEGADPANTQATPSVLTEAGTSGETSNPTIPGANIDPAIPSEGCDPIVPMEGTEMAIPAEAAESTEVAVPATPAEGNEPAAPTGGINPATLAKGSGVVTPAESPDPSSPVERTRPLKVLIQLHQLKLLII
nr:mucin-2-like [Penaeus vannamei]